MMKEAQMMMDLFKTKKSGFLAKRRKFTKATKSEHIAVLQLYWWHKIGVCFLLSDFFGVQNGYSANSSC